MQDVVNAIGSFLTWALLGSRNSIRVKLADGYLQVQ